MQNKIPNSQAGVSLIITFFIMIIALAVVVSISTILYSEIKIVRNIGNSTGAFYAADSGIEKVLYYDYQTKAMGGTRGLCAMYDSVNNPEACQKKIDTPTLDPSISCEPVAPKSLSTDQHDGCNPQVCDACEISFKTNFDVSGNYYYTATAQILTVEDEITGEKTSNFTVESKGTNLGSQRQIEVLLSTKISE
ncbi:MAG: pilus assembly PilX N-terminal domain-containing protein [Candidatus Staskawiczbacteria bacterium]|nr:pilus assembly PilX N-terminal domain-containing protein [Candidatus Staskawiczbacteria bacterium]